MNGVKPVTGGDTYKPPVRSMRSCAPGTARNVKREYGIKPNNKGCERLERNRNGYYYYYDDNTTKVIVIKQRTNLQTSTTNGRASMQESESGNRGYRNTTYYYYYYDNTTKVIVIKQRTNLRTSTTNGRASMQESKSGNRGYRNTTLSPLPLGPVSTQVLALPPKQKVFSTTKSLFSARKLFFFLAQ